MAKKAAKELIPLDVKSRSQQIAAYLERGWAIGYGDDRWTTDLEEADGWWPRESKKFITVQAGAASGLLVVRVHSHLYTAWADLQRRHRTPKTPTVVRTRIDEKTDEKLVTRYYLYHLPRNWQHSEAVQHALGDGIALLASGEAVYLPPSTSEYRWQHATTPVAALPAWLAKRCLIALVDQGDNTLVRNFVVMEMPTEAGGKKEEQLALDMETAVSSALRVGEGWPKRVGRLLYITLADPMDATQRVPEPLREASQLFSHLHLAGQVKWWGGGCDNDGASFIQREELYHALGMRADHYAALEVCPHEPPIEGHLYLWQAPDYTPDGRYLDGLLDFWPNMESAEDRALLRAMFLTPAWGGPYGARPMFVLEAEKSQSGKSKIAAMLGRLYGDFIELSSREGVFDAEAMLKRILTPDSLHKRIFRLDNVKTAIDSDVIEKLVTSDFISGHQMHVGEASRPNTAVVVVTANGASLSQDSLNRSYIIRVTMPRKHAGWETELESYLKRYRHHILADILWTLKSAPKRSWSGNDVESRQDWIEEVLCRACEGVTPDQVMTIMFARRLTHNADAADAHQILDALQATSQVGREDCLVRTEEKGQWYFLTLREARMAINDYLGTHYTGRRFTPMMRRHISEGHFDGQVFEHRRVQDGLRVRRPKDKTTISDAYPSMLNTQ